MVQRLEKSSLVHKKCKALSELYESLTFSVGRSETELKRLCVNGSLFFSKIFG